MALPPSGDALAFEAALRDNPHDLAGWCAYADWLAERGDPRGAFMQVQLALEDESRSKEERKQLQTREAELLKEHEREWLGELAPFVLDQPEPDRYDPVKPVWTWRRGSLGELRIGRLGVSFARTLADSNSARLLQVLHVHNAGGDERGPAPNPPGIERYSPLFELIGTPLLFDLRVFQFGPEVADRSVTDDRWVNSSAYDCWTYQPGLEHVIASLSRVEELNLYCKEYDIDSVFDLTNLTNLRVLRVYHLGRRGSDRRRDRQPYAYPLGVLAANPTFGNLTHLLLHPHHEEYSGEAYPQTDCFLPLSEFQEIIASPHLTKITHLQFRLSDMGDEGVRELIGSGFLERLRWLDLRHGCITDEGAKLFATCPDIRNLEHLDLSRNAVTQVGLNLLKQMGINVRADYPLTDEELDEQVYLCEGDSE